MVAFLSLLRSSTKCLTHLITSTSQSLDNDSLVSILASHGQQDLTNVDTSDCSVRLSISTTHTSLESICTSARQHLVDSDDVVRVDTDSQVEGILSGGLDNVLVRADTGGFQSFG